VVFSRGRERDLAVQAGAGEVGSGWARVLRAYVVRELQVCVCVCV
jgi:hypothetical protein